MFKNEIRELYNFQSKEELVQKFSTIKQDRKSVVLYDFRDVKWILMPNEHQDIKIEDIELYQKLDRAKVMFREKHKFTNITHQAKCRILTDKDSFKFTEFHKACPIRDKEKGMVSLADPTVYGCFENNKLVSVASLWNWGEKLSDIGILTHPKYRGLGYAESVCKTILNEIDRHIIWRCDDKNVASNVLAKKLGFIETGAIFNLVKRS